jgi:hypothetical protein
MSEDLIITPGGPRPRSMVHKVETGHVIAMATGRLLKRHISGRVMADLGPVVVRPEVAEAPQKPLLPNPAVQWIVYATWTAPPGQPVVSFKTTWVVPPPPRTQNNQLIYLFNGIQNSSWIYQPVLQWGNSPDPGGGNYWSVASWLADGQNGPAFYSPLIRVNPGDVLTGIITLTRQYGNLFDYDCVFAGLPGSCLPIRGVQQLTNCVETLEAYDKTGQNPPANCSDYPFVLKTAMAAIEIRSGTGEMTLTWQKQNLVTACGQHAVPVSDKSPGGEVDLYYVNPAAPAAPQRRDHLQPNQGLLAGQALTSQAGSS